MVIIQDRHSSCAECHEGISLFSALNAEDRELLCQTRAGLRYSPGEVMIRQGDLANKILFIRQGIVSVQHQERRRTIILTLETEGALLGLPVLYTARTYPYTVIPFTETDCCQFELHSFQQVIRRNGEFAAMVMEQMNDYTLRSFARLHTLTLKQLHGRLADIMICLHDRIYKSTSFSLPMSRRQLADITVMSSESLSRILREFRDDGILSVDGKDVHILDIDRMRKISQSA
jgi:CRP-like cAMP-binding protein